MKKLIVILIGSFFVECTGHSNIPIEQKALDIFIDSVFHKTYYFEADSGYFILPPINYKEEWATCGMFCDWEMIGENTVINVSQPISKRAYSDNFDNVEISQYELINELKASNDSIKLHGFKPINLTYPNNVTKMSLQEYQKLDHSKTAFISVMHHIESKEKYLVQIKIRSKDFVNDPIFDKEFEEYNYYFWFYPSGSFVRWE